MSSYLETKRLKYIKKDWPAFLNFLESIEDRNKQLLHLQKHPFALYVDPASFCNLQCPFCPTGMRINAREPESLALSHFKKLIDEVGHNIFHIYFYNWGEPLLNHDLVLMLDYIKKFSISSEISTNLSIALSYERAVEIMNSKIDRIIMSVDGASQESYQKYRVGGNLALVFKNMKLLVDAKIKTQNTNTLLVWRFLVFKHNQHEIDKAKSIAKELSVEIVFEKPYISLNSKEWASTIEKFRPINLPSSNEENSLSQIVEPINKTRILNSKLVLPKSCDWLWFMPVINGNGNVSPCCITVFDKDDFGNIKEDKLISILNNKKFVNARKLASGQEIEPNLNLICEKCPAKEIWNYSDDIITLVFESLLLKLAQYYPQVKDLTVHSIDWDVFQKLKEMVISQVQGIEFNEHNSKTMSTVPDAKKTSKKFHVACFLAKLFNFKKLNGSS
jgi:radical SAM protein with 4Fe4S-binding SPASM domain